MFTPDWKTAPDWAMFAAMDSDGQWYWYENPPVPKNKGFGWTGMIEQIRNIVPNWKESVQARPGGVVTNTDESEDIEF